MELEKFIWKFVSKDKFKPAMCGVYMDPEEKAAVATDAHVMLVCHELYDPLKSDLIVYKDGSSLKNGTYTNIPADSKLTQHVRYPNWKPAIPREYRERESKKQQRSKYDTVYEEVFIDAWFKDRVLAATKLSNLPQFKGCQISVCVHRGRDYWVAPRFAKMMMSWGLKGWHLKHSSSPAINERSDGDLMMVMPMMPIYENDDFIAKDYGIKLPWTENEKDIVLKIVKDEFDLPIM